MNDVELRLRRSIRAKTCSLIGIGVGCVVLFAVGPLLADEPSFDPIPAAAAAAKGPISVSPISPFDPLEGTAGAHAVPIGTVANGGAATGGAAKGGTANGGYVKPAAFLQSAGDPAAAPEQLPAGGYLWGGSPDAPGPAGSAPAGSYPLAGYSVIGSTPPPESVDPPPAGNVLGGLGFGVSAPIGVPPLGPLMSDHPITLMPGLPPEAIHTVFHLHQSITDEVGDDGPITSIGGFFPHTTANGIWFFDGEFNLLEDPINVGQQTENFGANLGLGWRWIVPSWDSIAGLSFWYDLDRTRPDFVHQAGVSGELLGDLWQARMNLYFPCGTNRLSSFTALGPAYYVNENIAFGQTRYDNLDMGGMDFEFGRRLPGWLGDNGVSAYVGGYYYRADQAFNTFGVATRVEALISPNLTIDVKYTNDSIFKNRVGIGVTWLLPNGKCKSCADTCCSEVYRLTEPVERNRTVVYATQVVNNTQLAINPATGTPVVVVHVNSAAPAGGNGTVNDPYNNLPAAQTGSAPNDIILVQGGSMFSGQSITLQNSQRFLGEGVPHTVATVQEGTIALPTVSSSTVLPVIANAPGNAVTLANSNEVSGFTINNSGGAAIAGNGISGTANINNVNINGGATGISIQNSSAAVTVASTPINGAATGINLTNNTGSFDFTGTQTVAGSTSTGVLLSGNSSPVTFDNLQLNATTGTGLSATNQTGTLTISAGAITAAAGTAVAIDNSATTAAPLAITLASVNSANSTNGISLNNAGGTFTVTGSGTTAGSGGTISDSTGAGVAITGESGTVALNYMNITDPVGDGVDVTNSAAAANVTVTGAQIALTGTQTGVNVANNSGALNLNNSTVTGGGVGLNVAGSSGTENVAGFTSNNSATGINLATNTGTFNATGTTAVNGSTSFGVDMSNNSGAATFANLQVAATTGTGLSAVNQTGTLTISAGSITASDGTGVSIDNSASATAAPLAVTLASINATGGTNGISLNNAAGTFTVTGSGTTAGSGGTISDTTGAGVAITGESGTVALNYMNITDPAGTGVNVLNSAAAANVSLTGAQVTLAGGQTGVNVQNNSGTFALNSSSITGGATGLQIVDSSGTNNLANLTVANSGDGIVIKSNSGTTDATGTTTVNGTTSHGVAVDSNTGAVTFDNLQIAATSGIGLESSSQTGTLTISAGSVSNANGEAVNIQGTGATGAPLAVTLQSVSSTGGPNGINLQDAGGTFSVTGTGTTAGSGGTISGSSSDGVLINQEVGTVSLSNMNVTNPGGDGANITNVTSTGSVTLAGMQISGAGTNGVSVQSNAGTVTVGTSSVAAANVGVNITGNTGTTNVNSTTVTGGATGVSVSNSSGIENFAGLTVNNAGVGISMDSNTGTINATGTTTVTGSTSVGVDLETNSAPITFNDLEVSATSGTGLNVVNQTGALTISGGNVASTSGTGLVVDNSAVGDAPLAVSLTSVSSGGGTYGLELYNVSGNFTVTGSGTTAGSGGTLSNATSVGAYLQNVAGNVTLDNMNVTSTVASTDGVAILNSGSLADVTLNNINVSDANQNIGIVVSTNAGAVNINNSSVTGGTTGVSLVSSSGTENAANLTVTNAATGINLSGLTGAPTFTGTTTVNGSTVDGVTINNVTQPITFATLDIAATSGVAFSMTNSPTTLTITGGTISNASGDAVDISGNAVLAVTLDSVSASGGTNGINLGSVAGSITVNGGTISNTADQAIFLNGFANASFNNMTLGASGGEAVVAENGMNFTFNNSSIATQTTAADGVFIDGVTGTTNITGNRIEFGDAIGVELLQTTAGGTYHIDNNIVITTSTTLAAGLFSDDVASGNNTLDISGNIMFLGTASSGTGIDLFKQTGTDFLSSSSDNTVFATTAFTSAAGAGGSFSGTISVNGTPEP